RIQFQRTTPPLLHALATRYRALFSAKVIYFAATISSQRSPTGIEIGFISSFNYRRVPAALRALYAFPLEVFESHATFSDLAPVYALARDLSGMISVTPGQIQLFADSIASRPDAFLAYLKGTQKLPDTMPPVRATSSRLALLERALAKRPFSFREVWPSLS